MIKKSLLLVTFFLLTFSMSIAQNSTATNNSKEPSKVIGDKNNFNYWTVELSTGFSKGLRPYTQGYFSSNPKKVLGDFNLNNVGLGLRYMFSSKAGLKFDFNFDRFKNSKYSPPFYVEQFRYSIQGVVNAARIFDIQEQLGRFSLLIHAGVAVSSITPKPWASNITNNTLKVNGENVGGSLNKTDYNGGYIFGFTPEFRIAKKLSFIADFSMLTNVRQHFAWDGHYAASDDNLSGQMTSLTFGFSYALGKNNIGGDWVTVKEEKSIQFEELAKRIGDVETLMNDSDKDGVPDYLDVEPNSIPGVAVNTKGIMIDLNKNGIADELENYLNNNYADKVNVNRIMNSYSPDVIKKFINDGYIATYFETNLSNPTNVSTEGIDFILTYLRNNPSESIDIIGHADEIGNSKYNYKLATDRAKNIKVTLQKAGIESTRMNIVSYGEDTSVDSASIDARRLARKVTFRVK